MSYRRFMRITARALDKGEVPEDMVRPILCLRRALRAVPFGFRNRVFRWILTFLALMGTEVVEDAVDQN